MIHRIFFKKQLCLLCIALFSVLFLGCDEKTTTLPALIGTWDGYSFNGEVVKVVFVDGKKNKVIISVDDVVAEGTYTIDQTVRPFHLIYNLGEPPVRRDAILTFLGSDTIQIETSAVGTARLSAFTDKCEILKRRN